MLSSIASPFDPSLPKHCEPTTEFLLRFSSTFHTCIPTPLAFVSNTLGILSIISWLFAQLPQIYKNWRLSNTSGLSIFFLVEWCLGDLSNLLGAIFTHQASWQIAIGSYYVFVDLCLVGQWLWYEKLRHGRRIRKVRQTRDIYPDDWSTGGMHEVAEGDSESSSGRRKSEDTLKPAAQPRAIVSRTPRFERIPGSVDGTPASSLAATPHGTIIQRVGPSSPFPSPSPRVLLLIACLAAIVQASPVTKPPHLSIGVLEKQPTRLENAGTVLAWMSTALYLGSRLPQLIKNWRRKSTSGLSPSLFAAAFCGNLFYSSAIATNPDAWFDFGPYGGGGWAGRDGSDRAKWIAAALPFFLGAFGVLGLDGSVGVQFMLYHNGDDKVIVEERKGRRWRWRRVSGWMRGWIPSVGDSKETARERLLDGADRRIEGYGTLS